MVLHCHISFNDGSKLNKLIYEVNGVYSYNDLKACLVNLAMGNIAKWTAALVRIYYTMELKIGLQQFYSRT